MVPLEQLPLFARAEALSALDQLFGTAQAYRTSSQYAALMRFLARFTDYSPYNCFLLHVQNPEITFVATAARWLKHFQRIIKPRAHPLIILAPHGPVMFVYDYADTEGPDILPSHLKDPFATLGDIDQQVFYKTVDAARQRHIELDQPEFSFAHAGSAIRLSHTLRTNLQLSHDIRYLIEVNQKLSITSQYATLVHELGHILSGHLGKFGDDPWPNRHELDQTQVELEAESISYLVCMRQRIQTKSAEYLAQYAKKDQPLDQVSLDTVLKVSGKIEQMGAGR